MQTSVRSTRDAAPAASYRGPTFRLVEEVSWEELERRGGFAPRPLPLLVRGAAKRWPAWERWTFERLAELRNADGSEVVTSFQNGLTEQGATRKPLIQPVAPYLRELARQAADPARTEQGLLPARRHRQLRAGESFHLDWSYLKSFEPDRVYLAQWYILNEFPALRRDFDIRALWPGLRWTWEYTFIGPAHTVTGLHFDFPNNWFCQVTGVKEFLLFPPNQTRFMCKSRKYDWGATLSDIDVTQLDEQPERARIFAQAHGLYARIEPGDALFVPRRTWHLVNSLSPSISLAVFGLTPWEIVAGGGPSQFRALLHWLGLYRAGNCTCHEMHAALALE